MLLRGSTLGIAEIIPGQMLVVRFPGAGPSLAALNCAEAQGTGDDFPDRLLTNQDVIEMLGGGMTPLAVISRITVRRSKFDKSAAGLEVLKRRMCRYHVVLAMMKAPEVRLPRKAARDSNDSGQHAIPSRFVGGPELQRSAAGLHHLLRGSRRSADSRASE